MLSMALTDDLARRVEKKRLEIAALERQLEAAHAYIQAMEEALKLAERNGTGVPATREAVRSLRKGSMPAKAYPILKRAGRPIYVATLLEEMGEEVTTENKRALASALSAYARKKDIFTRPEPNTFGLVELSGSDSAAPDLSEED